MKSQSKRPEGSKSSFGEMMGVPPVQNNDDAAAALFRAQCMTDTLKEILFNEHADEYCHTALGEMAQIAYELTQQVISYLETDLFKEPMA